MGGANERTTAILEGARDDLAGFIAVSDNDHKYIHEGYGFSIIGNTGALSAAASWYISFRTPIATSGRFIHLRPAILSSTANLLLMQVHEGSLATVGTAATPINLNRNKQASIPSKVVATTNATSVTDGTAILQMAVGAAGTGNASGGGGGAGLERVLKPDTLYTIKFTNIGTATATTGYFDIYWYEELKG
jgi:hypothetical protein